MDRFLPFFDYPPTPSGQTWTFSWTPTLCPRGNSATDHLSDKIKETNWKNKNHQLHPCYEVKTHLILGWSSNNQISGPTYFHTIVMSASRHVHQNLKRLNNSNLKSMPSEYPDEPCLGKSESIIFQLLGKSFEIRHRMTEYQYSFFSLR